MPPNGHLMALSIPVFLRDLYNFCEHAVNGRKYPMPNPFPISTPNPPSVLPVSLRRFY
jgi:hypothetical protein